MSDYEEIREYKERAGNIYNGVLQAFAGIGASLFFSGVIGFNIFRAGLEVVDDIVNRFYNTSQD